ncbi:hypothetical protein [Nostoc linckia]|uniref:hypothetical protein n=1 Tax=Nostoc linckia TaxID=92942 RepID=UPI0015D51F20|nr:hypothetical protein [Nostoc linckia]
MERWGDKGEGETREMGRKGRGGDKVAIFLPCLPCPIYIPHAQCPSHQSSVNTLDLHFRCFMA